MDWVEKRTGAMKWRGRLDSYFRKFGIKGEQRIRIVIAGDVASTEGFEEIAEYTVHWREWVSSEENSMQEGGLNCSSSGVSRVVGL